MQAAFTISVGRAQEQDYISHYALYWGRRACKGGGGQTGAKNGLIRDLEVGASSSEALPPDTMIPLDSTHILVFAKNKYGESDHCVSAKFEDNKGAEAEEKKEL